MSDREEARQRRKLERERDRLIQQARWASHDYNFATDAFKGHIAGPRLREKYAAELERVEARLLEIEAVLGLPSD